MATATPPAVPPAVPSTATHATFVIERTYDAAPARVWAAFADREAKQQWFSCMDPSAESHMELDFRVGGREVNRIAMPGGPVHRMEATYWDVVPERRFVYSYAMHVGDAKLSVSLVTVELSPAGAGTRLVFTEQAAFLDGHQEPAERERGTEIGLERLGELLRAESASA
ncbi:SRPBCC family protein [Roseisolibacter agri]|uniref:Activator of HSP90 ATPase n=1 Tax=Roseisolibacter agri TaxID=2014610 RepID=A0AA37Q3H4_9BACT|nr:SRPBCC family protein [Roseisolibacter agri]GLC25880.1 activator of HSP90 ATPase [Roseisolibacter agri]